MAKVTGIGGVFFKSKGKGAELGAWYKENLGIELESWGGAILRWADDKADDDGLTVWNAADHDTKWFSPSESSFMINYRIDNMHEFSLFEKDRAELIGKIIRSLPSPVVAEDEDWVEEALRRDREMDEKPDMVLSEEQFFTSLREYVRK